MAEHHQTYLFAHQSKTGGGAVHQAKVTAVTYKAAKEVFERHYPEREITTTGIRGVS